MAQVTRLVQQQRGWLIDLDLASCFGRINTTRLFEFIKETLKERELRRLIGAWLDVETVVVERTGIRRSEAPRGILQGGILSPLFANIYLDRFDKLALRRGLKLVRYGDDIVVCCNSKGEAEAMLRLVEKLLAKLDLEVNPRKTALFHAEKGFRFLGQQLFLKASERGEGTLTKGSRKAGPPVASALPSRASSEVSDDGDD